jgi:ribosomal protein S18 acetylase RimI-like enzyme
MPEAGERPPYLEGGGNKEKSEEKFKNKELSFAEWKARLDTAKTEQEYFDEIYYHLPFIQDPQATRDYVIQELLPKSRGVFDSPLEKADKFSPARASNLRLGYELDMLKWLSSGIRENYERSPIASKDITPTTKQDYSETINAILEQLFEAHTRILDPQSEYSSHIPKDSFIPQDQYHNFEFEVDYEVAPFVSTLLDISTKLELTIDRSHLYASLKELYPTHDKPEDEESIAEYLVITSSEEELREAVREVCEKIKEEPENSSRFTTLLNRLETVTMPSYHEGVVTYLDTEYVLEGDHPAEIDAVKRLTNTTFGLFNQDVLLGYIEVLPTAEAPRGGKILRMFKKINPEDVFRSSDQNTELVDDFSQNYLEFRKTLRTIPRPYFLINKINQNPEHRKIFLQLHADSAINDLGLRDQFWLYQFTQKYPDRTNDLQNFLEMFRDKGLKAFCSMEQGSYNAELLLNLARRAGNIEDFNNDYYSKFDIDLPRKLFTIYNEIILQIDGINDYISNFFSKDSSVSKEDIQNLTEGLLHKAADILTSFAKSLTAGEKVTEETVQSLNAVKTDVIVFAETFKTFFKNKDQVDFSEIKDLQFSKTAAQELTPQDHKEMMSIAEHNWKTEGKVGEEVLKKFENLLAEPGAEFYILKRNQEIVAFMRLGPPTEDNHRSIGSFNVDSNARGAGIGEAMLLASTAQEAEQYVLDSSVLPKLPIGMKYVQRGSVINGLLDNYNNSGETFFQLQINKKINERITSKDMRSAELLERLAADSTKTPENLIAEEQKIVVLSFDNEQKEEMLRVMRMFLEHGYLGTDYRAYPKQKTKRIYVLERLEPEVVSESTV